MATKYKLTYFNVTGLGEPIRYLLAYNNDDFEDNRIEFADWEKIKATTPFGQVPLLEWDNNKVNQSSAICRYLAKQSGLAGENHIDQLNADAIVDTITDFRLNYTAYFREQDPAIKEKKFEDIINTHNPYFLGRLEEVAKKNGGYFVNNQLTWADIYFGAVSEMLLAMSKDKELLSKYPTLAALKAKVENLPGIKEYRSKRPETIL